MVKHIILWQLKDEYASEEKAQIAAEIKEGLEGLKGKIPGLLDIHVQVDKLDSSFESEEALKGYAVHEEHVKVADTKVRPHTKSRVCIDYEV